MFNGATNQASLSGNQMDESGFGECQEKGTCGTVQCWPGRMTLIAQSGGD